jgi:hypothetical protein
LDVRFDPERFQDDSIAPDAVDIMYFTPKGMDNNMMFVNSRVEIDGGATMGQDQRHRTIKRSKAAFTGNFYLPPLLKAAGLEMTAKEHMEHWLGLRGKFSDTLLAAVAPYGAMLKYEKLADLNSFQHEQAKRTCWCAQEAIYHSAIRLRKKLQERLGSGGEKLVACLAPPCLRKGKCTEGVRYCGRHLADMLPEKYFSEREI